MPTTPEGVKSSTGGYGNVREPLGRGGRGGGEGGGTSDAASAKNNRVHRQTVNLPLVNEASSGTQTALQLILRVRWYTGVKSRRNPVQNGHVVNISAVPENEPYIRKPSVEFAASFRHSNGMCGSGGLRSCQGANVGSRESGDEEQKAMLGYPGVYITSFKGFELGDAEERESVAVNR
ncbi:hypothetical protein DFH09DRAFT_1104858 [Mycena vulgaris]|nr:hypothetical protein DFH09DRAFT_1104858 [Mycena vulgaris]